MSIELDEEVMHSIDHYKFWSVRQKKVNIEAEFRGQFEERRFYDTILKDLRLLGNPAKKTRRGMNERDLVRPGVHLLGYRIEFKFGDDRSGWVELANQLKRDPDGEYSTVRWELGLADRVLVPACKLEGHNQPIKQFPGNGQGDHYLCYKVTKGEGVNVPMRMTDQFSTPKRPKPPQITAIIPEYFAVPVRKRHGIPEETTRFTSADAHLAIYRITGQKLTVPFTAIDQFSLYPDLIADQHVAIGIPSVKRKWDYR